MLTSCREYREGDVTGVPSETTSLTLTDEIIPEKTPDGDELPDEIILAVYNPFSDLVKADFSTEIELRAAVAKINSARLLIADDYSIFENTYYVDYGDIIEGDETTAYMYSPFNTKIAADEDELFAEIRQYFTENYITDEELKKQLFENDRNDPPKYRTIDGRLCARCGYDGAYAEIYTNRIRIISNDEDSAEIVLDGAGVADYFHVYITLVKNGNIWQADEIDFRVYDETFANIVATGLLHRQKNLNNILGGGTVPKNAKTVEIDGEKYTETKLTKTIAEMKEFFAETFRNTALERNDSYEMKNGGELCSVYTEKYINSVYIERDGVLYRKDNAPKWYLPQIKFDPYDGYKAAGGDANENYYFYEENFFDSVKNESFTQDIAISYTYDWDGEYKYHGIYIASELPIKELE